jgi:hypothetical protein
MQKPNRDRQYRTDRLLQKLLAIMRSENSKPFPVGPFTRRWSRAWWWYYEVLKWNRI